MNPPMSVKFWSAVTESTESAQSPLGISWYGQRLGVSADPTANPKGILSQNPGLRCRRAEPTLWRAAKAEGTSYPGKPGRRHTTPTGLWLGDGIVTQPRWG